MTNAQATLSVPFTVYEGAMNNAVNGNDMLNILEALVDVEPTVDELLAEAMGYYGALELSEDAENIVTINVDDNDMLNILEALVDVEPTVMGDYGALELSEMAF